MAPLILINNVEKFSGRYVATKTFQDKEVLTSGSDPIRVFNAAKKKGANDPVIFFVPEKDITHIYNAH